MTTAGATTRAEPGTGDAMIWTLDDLAGHAGGRLTGAPPAIANLVVPAGVSIDSRTLAPGELYVALRGERHDGHDFVRPAVARGAAALLVEHDDPSWTVPRIVVDDALLALTRIARAARSASGAAIVGITGSNGKTTTRSLATALLAGLGPVLEPRGNRNNHIGLPLTLAHLIRDHRVAVLELGMNHLGEIHDLSLLARPGIAVITNLARAHVGPVGGIDAVRRAKLEIVDGLEPGGTLVVPDDDPALVTAAHEAIARAGDRRRVLTVGEGSDADVRVSIDALDEHGHAAIRIDDADPVRMPTPGRPVARAAALAVAVARLFGVDAGASAEALAGWRPVAGRLVLREGERVRILDDSYNANPDSMAAALDTLRAIPAPGRRVAVLGDMRELGDEAPALHRELADHVHGVDHVVLVGTEVRATHEALVARGVEVVLVADADGATDHLATAIGPDDLVLVKGSRGVALDRVVRALLGDGGEA